MGCGSSNKFHPVTPITPIIKKDYEQDIAGLWVRYAELLKTDNDPDLQRQVAFAGQALMRLQYSDHLDIDIDVVDQMITCLEKVAKQASRVKFEN